MINDNNDKEKLELELQAYQASNRMLRQAIVLGWVRILVSLLYCAGSAYILTVLVLVMFTNMAILAHHVWLAVINLVLLSLDSKINAWIIRLQCESKHIIQNPSTLHV